MELIEFVTSKLSSELACVQFLQKYGLTSMTMFCVCGAQMSLRKRTTRSGNASIVWRCSKKYCRIEKSVRSECCFPAYKRSEGRVRSSLTLCKIVQITYSWLTSSSTYRQLRHTTGCCLQSIVNWLNLSREVTSHAIEDARKLVGTPEKPVQIDEAYFRGRRKYKRGRLLNGDFDIGHGLGRHNNYGSQIVGPWVLCIYQSKSDQRFVVIPDRKGSTLLPIIQKYVQAGSTIVTDEWSGYNRLAELGLDHETVNHSDNYVNPQTGYHTQGVERAWVDAKAWLKRVRYPSPYMQSHLDELAWEKYNKDRVEGLVDCFFKEVAKFYKV